MNDKPKIDIATRVEQYVKLRDEIKKRDTDHKNMMRPYREAMETLNGLLLEELNTVNADSVRTGAGTVYRTEKKSASVADKTAFWAYVVSQGAWDLLDYKANPVAVADFIHEQAEAAKTDPTITPAPPPGINFTTTFVAGVRRA